MSWLDDIGNGIGNFLGNVSGNTQLNRAGQAQQGAMSGLQTAQNTAGGLVGSAGALQGQQTGFGGQMQQGVQQSMGANAADYQKKALAAAQAQAGQQAQMASAQGAANAASAARAGGVNAGQAGLGAGQSAANMYTQTYVPAVTAGINQYQAGTGQMMNQGQMAMQNALGAGGLGLGAGQLQAGAAGTMGQLGVQQQQSGQQQMNSLLGGVGSLIGLKSGGEAEGNKPFPLLVESGERVQTEPYHGPDVKKIWDFVKEAGTVTGGIAVANKLEKGAAKDQAFSDEKAKEKLEKIRRTPGYWDKGEAPPGYEQYEKEEGKDYNKFAEGGDMLVSDQTPPEPEKPKEDVLGDIGKILSIGATIGMIAGLKSGGTVNYGPEGGATVSATGVQPLKAAFGVDVMNMGGGTNYVGGGSPKSDNSSKPKPLIDIGGAIKSGVQNILHPSQATLGGMAGGAGGGAGAMAQAGADFIVPEGYPDDSYPLTVEPGTHVKVTPRNEVKQSQALDMLKRKQLLQRMKSQKSSGMPDFPPEFTSLMTSVLRRGE